MSGKHTYTKGRASWADGIDGATPVQATHLTNFENGVTNAQDTANDAWDLATAANTSLTTDVTVKSLSAWATNSSMTPALGTLPADSYVYAVDVHVTQAFNSDGTDLLVVGWSGTTNALATSVDVSSTGVKSVTLGASAGYNSASHAVIATYTAGGSAASAGKALVVVRYVSVPTTP